MVSCGYGDVTPSILSMAYMYVGVRTCVCVCACMRGLHMLPGPTSSMHTASITCHSVGSLKCVERNFDVSIVY